MPTSSTRFPLSWPHLAALIGMLAAAALAVLLAPSKLDVSDRSLDLESIIPKQFHDWKEIPSPFVQMDLTPRRERDGAPEAESNSPYDQTVMRTYVRSDGAVVMLALAYGSRQRQEVKIHRPELCYVAQGFSVERKEHAVLTLDNGSTVTATHLLAQNDRRIEPVTYWIRIGDEISHSAWQSRLAILREGLQGRIPDGILVRASSAFPKGQSHPNAYRVQMEFLRDLVTALDRRAQRILIAPL